jgi:hypothetical protein
MNSRLLTMKCIVERLMVDSDFAFTPRDRALTGCCLLTSIYGVLEFDFES